MLAGMYIASPGLLTEAMRVITCLFPEETRTDVPCVHLSFCISDVVMMTAFVGADFSRWNDKRTNSFRLYPSNLSILLP